MDIKISSKADILNFAKKYYDNFVYTKDYFDEFRPPATCYKELVEGCLKDDCDGFHRRLLHCLQENGCPAAIMSIVYQGGGHAIVVFKIHNEYCFVDYTNGFSFFDFKSLEKYVTQIKYKDKYIAHYYAVWNKEKGVYKNGNEWINSI